jgi:hypothetical protein
MKNHNNWTKFKKLAMNLLQKLVLLLSVQYAVACHDINSTCCSVMINVMFNTVKHLSIVSERAIKK